MTALAGRYMILHQCKWCTKNNHNRCVDVFLADCHVVQKQQAELKAREAAAAARVARVLACFSGLLSIPVWLGLCNKGDVYLLDEDVPLLEGAIVD